MVWVGRDLGGHLVQSDIINQTRLLRAPSNLALDVSRDGALTTSLGNLGEGFTTFIIKNL